MNLFQQNDIIKDGDYYRIIFGIDGNRVNASDSWKNIQSARVYGLVHSVPISETKGWVIVERDGKPYVEEPWQPKSGETYWLADPTEETNALNGTWDGDEIERFRLARGILFRTEEEARECGQKMLDVVKK